MLTRRIGIAVRRGLLVAALLLPLAAALPASAQHGPLGGTYTFVPERSDNIDQAINRAIAGMNIVTRQVARSRLRNTNQPYGRIAIAHTPSNVTITTDARAPIVTPAGGESVRWTREDGEVFDVSTAWEGENLRQTFAAEDGRRVNRYSLSPDGNTLTLEVTVTSERLREPLTYRLLYRRAGA